MNDGRQEVPLTPKPPSTPPHFWPVHEAKRYIKGKRAETKRSRRKEADEKNVSRQGDRANSKQTKLAERRYKIIFSKSGAWGVAP